MNNSTMVYLAVDKDGTELIFAYEPDKWEEQGYWYRVEDYVELPPGTIKKLTGKTLKWDDGYVTYVSDDYEPE